MMDPDDLSVDNIKHKGNKRLWIKFNIFETQEKVNLLFAYLALNPFNKEFWISNICHKIYEAVYYYNFGPISQYNYVGFDEEIKDGFVDIFKTSIGGTNLTQSTYDLEGKYVDKYALIGNSNAPVFNLVEDLIIKALK